MPNSAPTDSGLLSVVLPAFNEEEMAPRAADVISALLEQAQIPHELIFVDDGSRDRTWARIQEKSRALPQVRGVRFSRNFGKEAAIFAGLAQARGDCVAVMDCDLQHPPEKVVEMYRLWQQGYQVVEGIKASRGKENPLHTFAARSFYAILSRATGSKTRLVWIENSSEQTIQALKEAGYCPLVPQVDFARRGVTSSSAAADLLSSAAAQRRANVTVWLGSDVNQTGLRALLSAAGAEEDQILPMTEALS